MKNFVALAVILLAACGAAAPACAKGAERPAAYTAPVGPAPINFGTYTSAVTMTRPPVRQEQGTYCRAYSRAVDQAGCRRESYGTACLQSDGSWRTVR